MFQFKLPDPGEGLTEAEITQWLVSEGDEVIAYARKDWIHGGTFAHLGNIQNFHLWCGNFRFRGGFGTARAWGNYRTVFFHDIYV